MSTIPHSVQGPKFFTVIIKDSSPVYLENQPAMLRSIRLPLTPEQQEMIRLRFTYKTGDKEHFEEISQIVVESE